MIHMCLHPGEDHLHCTSNIVGVTPFLCITVSLIFNSLKKNKFSG